jgi:hypothetical protein
MTRGRVIVVGALAAALSACEAGAGQVRPSHGKFTRTDGFVSGLSEGADVSYGRRGNLVCECEDGKDVG